MSPEAVLIGIGQSLLTHLLALKSGAKPEAMLQQFGDQAQHELAKWFADRAESDRLAEEQIRGGTIPVPFKTLSEPPDEG